MRRRCVTDNPVDEPRLRLLLWSLLAILRSKCSCEAGHNGAAIPMRQKRNRLQAVAVDRAMGEDLESTLVRRKPAFVRRRR